jgi:DNA-binding transcriptional LysR family regulator
MHEILNWNDLRVFLAVARAGGLAGATTSTRLSAPTLGRRMLALEHALGAVLFVRHRLGYDLTEFGRQLLIQAEGLEERALAVERWRAAIDPTAVVRIAAGAWTSGFIARHSRELLQGAGSLRLEIVTGSAVADLSRREANLGLRNRRPETGGLAGRRLGRVAFAAYGARALLESNPAAVRRERFGACDWVILAQPGPTVPSAQWLERQLARKPGITCTDHQALLAAAIAGAGLCVLPCFVGDGEPGLHRASEAIPELEHEQWLVSHDDDRHNRPIRGMADRLHRLMLKNSQLFAGELASGDVARFTRGQGGSSTSKGETT